MDWERKCIRLCAGMLVMAGLLRLTASGAFAPVGRLLQSPEAVSFFLYVHTGRLVRTSPNAPVKPIGELLSTEPEETEPVLPSFTQEEAQGVEVTYNCDYRPDLGELLTRPFSWDLEGEAPAVLILHTHTTECYTKEDGEEYEYSGSYRTLDEDYNMLCLGSLVARRLEEAGIRVIHDRNLHDYPDYNGSYAHAAASAEEILEKNPSIRLVLDLHRDAADTAYGQMVTACSIGSETAAQLMMVVGTDACGLEHPQWEENLSLALKLQILLERENPGICRPLNLSRNRYNQHLADRALLVEIGAAGNTLREAELAAEALARALIQLKAGAGSAP